MSQRGNVSPVVSRRASLATITPNVATSAIGSKVDRRGSLKNLANCRDLANKASMELQLSQLNVASSLRRVMLSTSLSSLPHTIPSSDALIDISGNSRPITAFEVLLENNLEGAPIYSADNHSHNIDGTIVFHDIVEPASPSSSASYAAISPRSSASFGGTLSITNVNTSSFTSGNVINSGSYTKRPELATWRSVSPNNSVSSSSHSSNHNHMSSNMNNMNNTSTMSTNNNNNNNANNNTHASIPEDDIAKLPHCFHRQLSLNTNHITTSQSTPATPLYCSTSFVETHALPALHTYNSTHSTIPSNVPKMIASRRRSSISLRDIGIGVDAPLQENEAPCPKNCNFKKYVGFLDIRDYISSIVYINTEQIDEDSIEYNSRGQAEVEVSSTPLSGLEGVANISIPQNSIFVDTTKDSNIPTERKMSVLSVMKEEEGAESKVEPVSLPVLKPLGEGAHGSLEGLANVWENIIKEGMRKRMRVSGSVSVSYLARRHPIRVVSDNSTMFEVCEIFRKGGRVVKMSSINGIGRILDVLNGHVLLRWLHSVLVLPEQYELAHMSPAVLNVGTTSIISINQNAPMSEALHLMDTYGKSGIAIVDDATRLVGATSIRLVKHLLRLGDSTCFQRPVKNVMKAVDASLNVSDMSDKVMVDAGAVVLDSADAKLLDVINAMIHHNSGRVFLVDEEGYAVRVLTIVDLFNGIAQLW